jgi:hypothetical protein
MGMIKSFAAMLAPLLLGTLVGCGGTTTVVHEVPPPPPPPRVATSDFTLSWELRADSAGGPSVRCLPGDEVVIEARDLDEGTLTVDRFSCADYGGTTAALYGAADYDLTIDLRDSRGAVLSTTAIRSYLSDNATSDLGAVIFVVRGSSDRLAVTPADQAARIVETK